MAVGLCACGGGGGGEDGSAEVLGVARFGFVPNSGDRTGSIYRVDATTGPLHHQGNGALDRTPETLAADPSGRFDVLGLLE